METIRILEIPDIHMALSRYVRAQSLFEQAYTALLDRDGKDSPITHLLEFVEAEMILATEALDRTLKETIASHVDEALKVAGLLHSNSTLDLS